MLYLTTAAAVLGAPTALQPQNSTADVVLSSSGYALTSTDKVRARSLGVPRGGSSAGVRVGKACRDASYNGGLSCAVHAVRNSRRALPAFYHPPPLAC